jgi:VIT1/CCC1 family predicted Fe2+/Mn2+ transporter
MITGQVELDGMRRRLLALSMPRRIGLKRKDYLAATRIFLLVVAGTFPVVVPFLMTDDAALAMQISRAVTLAMLFVAGFVLGRHAGHVRPAVTGMVMVLLGVALIAAVKALGG